MNKKIENNKKNQIQSKNLKQINAGGAVGNNPAQKVTKGGGKVK